jgi:hypothetical protein
VIYIGDYDPSGLFMSEVDLPARLIKYDGIHVRIRRVALDISKVMELPSFPATDSGKTLATRGSSPATATGAGNWMRWTRTISATALRRRSRS